MGSRTGNRILCSLIHHHACSLWHLKSDNTFRFEYSDRNDTAILPIFYFSVYDIDTNPNKVADKFTIVGWASTVYDCDNRERGCAESTDTCCLPNERRKVEHVIITISLLNWVVVCLVVGLGYRNLIV